MENPFQLMGLPAVYGLDLGVLEQRFLAESARHHPDRFTDPIDQAEAAERMSALTLAYRTLKDPEQRANALLALLGGPAKEDDPSLPPDLLMEVMEVREEMEVAADRGDASELVRLRGWAIARRAKHQSQIAARLNRAQPTPEDLKAARLELNAMRYMNRTLDQLPDTADGSSR
ncbi:MAG: Fe-S protein assembly co-chaperone HscB [Planctomycetota bacterium]